MAVRRVFVIWTHPIFHESVQRLLSHPDVEWVGATSNYATATDEILDLQPDTILIEESGSGVGAEVVRILKASSWSVRVVGLSLADNQLSVYRREQRVVGQAEDLLRFILGEIT